MEDGTQQVIASLTEVGNQIRGTKYVTLGLFSCMIYEYFLTLPDEIEYMWKRKFTPFSMLFIMTRYYSFAVLSVIMAGFVSPLFTPEKCARYVHFQPFAAALPLTFCPNMVIGIRVYALYQRSRVVGAFLVVYLLAEFAVALWIYGTPGSHPLHVPPEVAGLDAFTICIDIISDSLGNVRAALFQFMQTIFDTAVFGMIIYKATMLALATRAISNGTFVRRRRRRNNVISVIASQGVMYYGVIFTANFVWAMMIIFAPDGLKYCIADSTLTLNCIMANRITLGLRSATASASLADSRPTVAGVGAGRPMDVSVGGSSDLKFHSGWHARVPSVFGHSWRQTQTKMQAGPASVRESLSAGKSGDSSTVAGMDAELEGGRGQGNAQDHDGGMVGVQGGEREAEGYELSDLRGRIARSEL